MVLGLYVLLTFLLTWPMPFQMSTHLAGQSNDTYINPWANWWTEKVIREGRDLYFTRYMFYPHGVSLTLHSFSHLNTLFWFALRPLMGSLAAYNMTVLLAYPLSGYAMFALVRYLTGSSWAAFVAGLVFAFSPYHMVESAHPVLVTTQWLPLFLLFLVKTIRAQDERISTASALGKIRNPLLALLFLWLTGLTSWHLLAFALILAATYGVHSLIAERHLWNTRLVVTLIGVGLGCALLLAPLAYPIIREQLSTDEPHLAIPVHLAEGNDLLSFILPSPYHPLFGRLTTPVHERFKLAGRRPAYLGIVAVGLVLLAIRTQRRAAAYWTWAGLLFLVLSLGPYLEVGGSRLHDFALPWAVPVSGFFRNPFRFNTLVSFCLAVLVGLGVASLQVCIPSYSSPPLCPHKGGGGCTHPKGSAAAPSRRGRVRQIGVIAGLSLGILLEYVSVPLPRTPLNVSAFYHKLADQGGDGAVVEVPVGRGRDKEYMYYQTIHGRPTVSGVVSRPPRTAYRFFAEVPLLGRLQAGKPPDWSERHLFAQLAPLAQANVEYIIFHRQRLDAGRLEEWRDYFAFPPFFEDEQLVVYRTQPQITPVAELAPGLTLAWIGLPADSLRQGDVLSIAAVWTTAERPQRDWGLQIRVQGSEGMMAQQSALQCTFPLHPERPTSTWPGEAAVRGTYAVQVDPYTPSGKYDLAFALFDASDDAETTNLATVGTIEINPLERSFRVPPLGVRADAVFSDTLTLLGYELYQEGVRAGVWPVGGDENGGEGATSPALHVTLHWQALRRPGYYKIFVHVYDAAGEALIAQSDAVPRQWTYPTNWWEAGEVVSDDVVLSLEDVPPGVYRIRVGVYDPETLERLPVFTGKGDVLGDCVELEDTLRLP